MNEIWLDIDKIWERFWNKVDMRGTDDCWNWTFYKDAKGYGIFHIGDRTENERSHRVAYMLTKGDIPKGNYHNEIQIQHLCNNPSCCNPRHLIIGTNSENIEHKVFCNRQYKATGENNPSAKLTENDVREIIALYKRPKSNRYQWTLNDIANKYDVSIHTIKAITAGRLWQHIYNENVDERIVDKDKG